MNAIDRLIKRCQIGVGGRHALEDAHDIMAECYGTLGRLRGENERLRTRVECLRGALKSVAGQLYELGEPMLGDQAIEAAGDMEPPL